MNASRRVHCLRAHRPKPPTSIGENLQNSCGCQAWCGNERTMVETLCMLIVMVILVAVWGAWAKRDS